MKIKFFLIAFITFTTTVKAQVQVPSLPISDSVKRAIIHYVTDANLDFMAYKNPNIPVSRKYNSSFDKIMTRYVLKIDEILPYDPPFFYSDFLMDVKTWDGKIFYATKKNNCFLREIYSDSKHKDLVQRDTLCVDLDTGIFINNNRFVVMYNPQWPITDRFYPLAGNLHTMESEVFQYDNDPGHFAGRLEQVRYRLYQFGNGKTVSLGGNIRVPDTCKYFLGYFRVPGLSTSYVKVKFPKRGPMDYIEIEFYTNNRKYTKETGYDRGEVYKVKYVLRNDAESIYEWYPKVTKLSNEERRKVIDGPENEFREVLRGKDYSIAPPKPIIEDPSPD